jgi:serine/threonine protein kinase/Tfp pilus assembly protein PilF
MVPEDPSNPIDHEAMTGEFTPSVPPDDHEAKTGDITPSASPSPVDPQAMTGAFSPDETADQAAPGGASGALPAYAPGTIGGYTIRRILGEGGMGTVFEAEQASPKRIVALKVIRAGVVNEHLLRRFEHEAQVLGKLDHPGIATIYEAGTFQDRAGPQPYFAMEFVEGLPLNEFVIRRKLGTHERLSIIARIAEAVQHAHQKGIIHRDLKPGNILVTHDGQVKILDFGVARATDADIHKSTVQTDIGQLVGTVPYMSPEQAAGDPDELDTRSDVYALGVVAYELLAGSLPYNLHKKMIHEAVRIIREDDPTPLSSINRVYRGDIEIIINKALEKDKERRYQSAGALAQDIERYLNDEPIVARPPSRWYQWRKFTKRNKALVTGVAMVLAVSVIGTVVSVNFAIAETKQRKLAEQREDEANIARAAEARRAEELQLVVDFQTEQLGDVDPRSMGLTLRDGLRQKLETLAIQRNMPPDEMQAMLDTYDQLVAGADFTGLALQAMERHIFADTRIAIDRQFGDQPVLRASLLQTLADTMQGTGLIESATEPQTEALAIRRAELKDDHAQTITSINSMGALLQFKGQLKDAEQYFREAVQRSRKVLGNEDPITLSCLTSLGVNLFEQSRFEEAKPFLEEALRGKRKVLGDDDHQTLISFNLMGRMLETQGDLAEAERYKREALAGFRRVLGDTHPDTLTALDSLGTLLWARENYEEAKACFRETLDGRRAVLGNDHPDTLAAINNMGLVLAAQDDLDGAERYFREALEGKRRVLGNDHPETLISISNLGRICYTLQRYDEADALGAEAVMRSRASLPPGHWYVGAFLRHHGNTLLAMKRYADCETRLLEAHRILDEALGAGNDFTTSAVEDLITLYDAWDDAEPDAGHEAQGDAWRDRLAEIESAEDADSDADAS